MNPKNILDKIRSYLKKRESRMEAQRQERQRDSGTPSYTHCKNCQTELQGMYCHKCGQYAYRTTPKMWTFIKEYIQTAYPWDSQILPTLRNLIRRPGYLTNEFIAEKYSSYVHPLKLNILFLLIVVTTFVLFSNTSISNNSLNDILRHEAVVPHLTLELLNNNKEYASKMQESPRDTIRLTAHLYIERDFPHIITNVQTICNLNNEEIPDTFIAAVPHILIEDSIIVKDDSCGYKFSSHNKAINKEYYLNKANEAWVKMINLITEYLPIIILLTSPVLAFALRIANLRDKRNPIYYFVFALHYTAFAELLFLAFYLISLLNIAGAGTLERIAACILWLYMTIAIKRVYNKSWLVSFVKALMINVIYALIALMTIITMYIIAISIILTWE